MAKWIWKFGEFEIYHNLLVHNRRQQYGYAEPVVWKLYTPEPVIHFRKEVDTMGGTFCVHACGNSSVTVIDMDGNEAKYGGKKEITLDPGKYTISIRVGNMHTFPCLYVDGVIVSDESWEADDFGQNWTKAACYDCFCDPEHTPEVFPFSYQPVNYVKVEELEQGLLFDFGKETFAKTTFTNLCGEKVLIQFGESIEEALDPIWSVIQFEDEPKEGTLEYMPYAFRYIYVEDKSAKVKAEYEYLPLEYRGSFRCDEPVLNNVWDVAAYTFHLNCREFFLDGIKRDRWVWSADAYQSLFVNRYLFLDQDIEKRTLIALAGKSPFRVHINTIMDYTFFWFISLYEYYITYGDKKFIQEIYPQMDEIMEFCLNRTDADGFMRGKKGDWIFIDWAEMDKTGALAGEQILYAKAMESYGKICSLLGKRDKGCSDKADALQKAVFDKFYSEEKKVFIDSYESGNEVVTRQSNILAYLFLPCSQEQKENIYQRVVLNDSVPQITTPYFKFYENQVHSLAGNTKLLEESIRQYYGSMLATGATTLYEEYDPTMEGTEHYAMYGRPYEKSLCHAWSASPIYLLGCFRMGVRNTGVAYDSFEVRPVLGDLKEFSGTVPVIHGTVSVTMNRSMLRVCTDVSGGTLWFDEKQYLLEPGKEVIIDYL